MKQLSVIVIVCLFFSFICLAEEREKPNIILINSDDMGWTDIAAFGSTYYKTPNIDRLISQGLKFTNAYAGAANCAPSRDEKSEKEGGALFVYVKKLKSSD
jgi:hypothetical protein